jgi:outer membrane protease
MAYALPPAMPGPGFPVFAVGTGVSYGEIRELVYKTRNDLLSRLDWPLAGVPQAVLRIGLPLGESVFFSGTAAVPLPGRRGLMKDYDWTDDSGSPTHYSQHDNILDFGYRLDLLFGFHVLGTGSVSLALLAGCGISHNAFTASDGYAEYPPGSTPLLFSGPVITYDLTLLTLEIGMAAEVAFNERFTMLAHCRISPGGAFGWAHDEHLLRDLEFFDDPSGGFFYTVGAGLRFGLSPVLFLELGAAWEQLLDTTGPSRQLDLATGSYTDLGDSGGASLSQFSVSLLLEWGFP